MGRPEGMNFDYAHTDETTIYHPRRSTLFVDQKAGKLELWLNEKSPEGDVITGRLTLSDAAKDFKLNEGAMFNLQDVIKIVKRNKFKFADAAQHGDFLINLQNFNAKVTATIKHVREQSGSSVDFIEKVVAENKHSPSFQLNVPIYEGYPKRVITVQTCLEASSSSIQFYFESVDLFELIDKDKEEAIAAELALFTEHFPCSVVHQS